MRRTLLFLLLLILSAGMTFAAGRGEGSDPDGPPEIVYYLWDDAASVQVVEAFSASTDALVVSMNAVPTADYEVKLLTVLAGGVEMDAYMQKRQTDMFAQFANGYIEPLDDLITQTGYDIDGVSAYESAYTLDGQVLAIPFRGASWYTYYNKAVFDAASEPYPSDYVENGTWTWETFQNVANRLSTGDGDTYGGLFYTWGSSQIVPALQAGVPLITQDGRVELGPSVPQSFRLRGELEEALSIIPLVELKVTSTHYSTAFFRGNVGMLIMGEWFPGQLRNGSNDGLFEGFTWDDWGVTRLPSDTPDYRSVGNPTFNHVHADSENKEAAFQFIGWMGSEAGAVEVARAGMLPSRFTEEVRNVLRELIPDEQSFEYYTEGATVMPSFYTKYGSRVEQTIAQLMEQYLVEGALSDEDLLEELESRLTEIVRTTD